MLSAGIKDLKNNLSRYLLSVKNGEDLLVTERGKVIARIVREDRRQTPILEALGPLIVKGQVALPSQKLDMGIHHPVEVPGKPVSEMAIEDRR